MTDNINEKKITAKENVPSQTHIYAKFNEKIVIRCQRCTTIIDESNIKARLIDYLARNEKNGKQSAAHSI